MTRHRTCGCGQVVHRTHSCRRSALQLEPPTPLDRDEFNRVREESRREARAAAAADAQELLPLQLEVEL